VTQSRGWTVSIAITPLRQETKSQLRKSLTGEAHWATRFNSHVKAWALYDTSIVMEMVRSTCPPVAWANPQKLAIYPGA
jgi:hypothetical protein